MRISLCGPRRARLIVRTGHADRLWLRGVPLRGDGIGNQISLSVALDGNLMIDLGVRYTGVRDVACSDLGERVNRC